MQVQTRRLMLVKLAAAVTLAAAASGSALAEGYPNGPIKIIVPFPPGGSAGAQAQLVARMLEKELNANVIVDYKPGAGTTIGAAFVAKAPPDGQTLYYAGTSHAISGISYKDLPYDAAKSFATVSLVAVSPLLVVANPSRGIKTAAELLALARSSPKPLSFSSSGTGASPHLVGEQLAKAAHVKLLHVPYKGSGPALTAILSNDTDFGVQDISVLPQIQAGKVIPLITTRRIPARPNIPTMADLGFNIDTVAWGGILAPAGTPDNIVQTLATAIAKGLQDPAIKDAYNNQGYEVIGSTPKEFETFLNKELVTYRQMLKDAGISF